MSKPNHTSRTSGPGTIGRVLGTWRKVRRRPLPFLFAWIGIDALSAAALAPVGSWGVQRLIASTDRYAVANHDLVAFLLTWEGMLAAFLAAVVALVAYSLARSSALLLAQRDLTNDRRGLGSSLRLASGAILGAARRLPSVLSLVVRQLAILLVLGAPFAIAIGVVVWIVLRGVDMYWLVNARPTRYWIGLVAVSVIGLAGAFVLIPKFLRWSVALPLVVLDNERPARAMRESVRVTRGRLRTIALARVGWFLSVEAIAIALLVVVAFASERLLAREVISLAFTAWLAGFAILAHALVVGAQSILLGIGDSLIVHGIWKELLGREESSSPAASLEGRTITGRVALAAIALVVAIGAFSAFGMLRSARKTVDLELTAHRGASVVAPENTFASIRAAAALGADRIEIDVMRSRDGALVLAHDVDFRRLANDPRRVADMTLEEIRAIDVGSWFDPKFASERMPTLDEAILMMRSEGIDIPLNVELKVNGDAAILAQRTIAALRDLGDTDSIVTSLSLEALGEVRRADPDRTIGAILTATFGDIHRMDVDVYSVPVGRATSGLRARARSLGREIVVWGVHDEDTLTNVALRGFDGVIAPDIGTMRRHLTELNELDPIERLLLAFRARLVE